MQQIVLMALVNFDQFTGREHSQVIVLLAVLALVSIAIWALVVLSIAVRQGSLIVLRLLGYINARRALRTKGTHSD